MSLTLTLSRKALNNVDDVAGRWQFEGGSAEENKRHLANYASVKRVTFHGTDQDGQNTVGHNHAVLYRQPSAGIHHA